MVEADSTIALHVPTDVVTVAMCCDDVVDVRWFDAEFFEIGDQIALGRSVFIGARSHSGIDEDVFAGAISAPDQVCPPLCFPVSVRRQGVAAVRVPLGARDFDEHVGGIATQSYVVVDDRDFVIADYDLCGTHESCSGFWLVEDADKMDVAYWPNASVFVDQCLVDDVCRHIHTSLFVSRPEALLDRPSFFLSSHCDCFRPRCPTDFGSCLKHSSDPFDNYSDG